MRASKSRCCLAQLSGPRSGSEPRLASSRADEETNSPSICIRITVQWPSDQLSNLEVGDWVLQGRIRRQISSPLALSRVSEHKRPSSGRLGAAYPSAGAFALHCAPPSPSPKKVHHCGISSEPLPLPSESLRTGAFHGHHQRFCLLRSHQRRPAGDQLQAGSVGDQPEGKGKEAVAKSGRGGAGA